MIKIRTATMKDAELICSDAVEDDLRDGVIDWRSWARYNLDAGPAYTGLLNGQILALGGVRLLDKGKGEVWFAMTLQARKYKFSTLRTLRMMLAILVKNFGLVELLAASKRGFESSHRLLKHLGFDEYNRDAAFCYFKLEV